MDSDRFKARLFLQYLGEAKGRFDERELAHKKVQMQLKALRKMGTESLREHIDKLEKNIAHAVSKEKKLLTAQKDEETFHADLRSKIHKLERKLGRYLSSKEARQKRIDELEAKVKHKKETKKEKLHGLREEINRLEALYRSASKQKGISKAKLNKVKDRIAALKEKLKK